MSNIGTVIGAGAGSVIPGVGTAVGGVLGSVFDSLFGSANPGGWQGNRFVPGDLDSRINKVNQMIGEYGLTLSDVDYNAMIESLYTESGWQARISIYLQSVVDNKRNAIENSKHDPENSNPVLNPDLPVVDQTGNTLNKPIQAGMSTTTLLILAGAALFFLKK